MDLYNKYQNNVLGVITDARYPRGGVVDPMAGIKVAGGGTFQGSVCSSYFKSAEVDNKVYASRYGASFVDKNSKKMNIDLREIVFDDFGFRGFHFP